MRYAPPGLCLNDFAVLHTDGRYHLLHLQGPWNDDFNPTTMETSYGHAVSDDLVTWQSLGPCFGVGRPGSFDASAIWTMHPFRAAGGTAMAYTGVRARPWPEQAIGMAFTNRDDATGWRRIGYEAVVRADPRWYRTEAGMAWRDPFVVFDEGLWKMVICASAKDKSIDTAGCVGFASSPDLVNWTVRPPLLAPAMNRELECPVLERTATGWLLFASMSDRHQIDAWSAPNLEADWTYLGPVAPSGPYAPRLVDGPDGSRLMLHTVQRKVGLNEQGELCRGMLAQPKKLTASPDDRVQLGWWSGTDKFFGSAKDAFAVDGMYELLVGEPVTIHLRGTSRQPVLSLECTERAFTLVDVHGGAQEQTHLFDKPAPQRSLRVLLVGEYLEIYADGQLVISAVDYRQRLQPLLHTGDSAKPIELLPLLPDSSPRDDISAVFTPHLHPEVFAASQRNQGSPQVVGWGGS